jgi:hypothetical protein
VDALLSVPLKMTLLPVVVKVVVAPKVTAPLKICVPDVVTLFAKVLVPVTSKLEVPVLVMAGLVPLMLKLPTVMARCKLSVALVMVNAVLVTPEVPPKLPLLVTVKVPALMEVDPP